MFDIHADPGTLISNTNNIALINAFKKLLNSRPDNTIPFHFEKGDKKYIYDANLNEDTLDLFINTIMNE